MMSDDNDVFYKIALLCLICMVTCICIGTSLAIFQSFVKTYYLA